MKHKLNVIYPDAVNMNEAPESIKFALTEILPHVWQEIVKGHFESKVDSMSNRVQAVLDSNRDYSRY